MTQFAVRDLRPNPFRHMDRYPIRRDKVEALKESLRKTGFWDNVVARKRDDKAEIAYGHHRLVALKEEYGPDHRVNVIVRDLDDAAMLQIMARENMEEWGTSAWVEMETVGAVIQAYDDGLIELREPDSGDIKYSPRARRAYSSQTVAEFLGWLQPSGRAQAKVPTALAALDLIREGLLTESDFEGLQTKQAEAVVSQARQRKEVQEAAARMAEQQAKEARVAAERAERQRVRHEEEARRAREAAKATAATDEERRREKERERAAAERMRQLEEERRAAERRYQREQEEARRRRELARQQASKVGKAVSRELKSGARGYRQAREIADDVIPMKERPPRDINDHARTTAKQVSILLAGDALEAKLHELVKWGEVLEEPVKFELAQQLVRLADRARKLSLRFAAAPNENLLALPGDGR